MSASGSHMDDPAPHDRITGGSPWLQAGRLGFRVLYAVTILAALGWTVSNIREIGPDYQAVVYRFGAIERIRPAGLLVAWPRPFEQVALIPSPQRVLQQRVGSVLHPLPPAKAATSRISQSAYDVNSTDEDAEEREASGAGAQQQAPSDSDYLLTGDSGVVQLDVNVFYRVTDAYDYALQQAHIAPALDRLATRNAIVLCAGRDLDGILVARPELVGSDSNAAEQRERLRAELVDGINRSLDALKAEGAGLGITVERVDIRAGLPASAIDAFNAVLTASQQARQAVADAQNQAARTAQNATQAANQTVQAAQAGADERVARARADTAAIVSLARANGGDPDVALRLYRERIAAILSQAKSVTTVDPATDRRLILQGTEK